LAAAKGHRLNYEPL